MTKLAISIDVEEDGLFHGRYPGIPPGVANVRELHRLDFAWHHFGIPLTLLPTYPVAADQDCAAQLRRLAREQHAEIGAHLHAWSTPPFAATDKPEPVRTDALPDALLHDKMATLRAAIEGRLDVPPRSFRAGRFDLGRRLLRLLPEHGFRVDSSVVPLRRVPDGPADHYAAPAEPHWHPGTGPNAPLLEIPLTMQAVVPVVTTAIGRLAPRLPEPLRNGLFTAARCVCSTGIHPAWFSLPSMKLAARLHQRRGGTVLNMFLHSSDLCPGAAPASPTEESVQRLTGKIRRFLEWLGAHNPLEGVTLGLTHATWPEPQSSRHLSSRQLRAPCSDAHR